MSPLLPLFLLISTASSQACKAWPGTDSWPAPQLWKSLNTTVDGRLFSTIPAAAPCHSSFNGISTYDAKKCASIQAAWSTQEFHYGDPTSIFFENWTNSSCLPTTDPKVSCTLGTYPNYYINATGAADIRAGVDFARDNNVRLVVKNTGHDFMGKSIGAGSLSIWTHQLKEFTIIKKYSVPGNSYTGGAVKVGAAVQVSELYEKLDTQGLVAIGGECAGVGVAGGFIQGGGHGPLSIILGLAADHALSFEVITAAGDLVTASAESNPDLFWALRGGGPGAWGVIVSFTMKTFPTMKVAGAVIQYEITAGNTTQFWAAVKAVHKYAPLYADNNLSGYYGMSAGKFSLKPLLGAGKTKAQLDAILKPLVADLVATGIPFLYNSYEYPTFLSGWKALFDSKPSGVPIAMSSRLVSRAHFASNTTELVATIRNIHDNDADWVGHFFAPGKNGVLAETSVNPVWKESIFLPLWVYQVPDTSENGWAKVIDIMNNVDGPSMKELTPGSGAYVNEANIFDPDWKKELFGVHYPRLLRIKKKWDPKKVFWAKTAVGSDDLVEVKGRLCAAPGKY